MRRLLPLKQAKGNAMAAPPEIAPPNDAGMSSSQFTANLEGEGNFLQVPAQMMISSNRLRDFLFNVFNEHVYPGVCLTRLEIEHVTIWFRRQLYIYQAPHRTWPILNNCEQIYRHTLIYFSVIYII